MNIIQQLFVASLITIFVFVIYKFILNPVILLRPDRQTAAKCPKGWKYNQPMCEPTYSTHCVAFDPSKFTSVNKCCEIAKNCGTSWQGMCA